MCGNLMDKFQEVAFLFYHGIDLGTELRLSCLCGKDFQLLIHLAGYLLALRGLLE